MTTFHTRYNHIEYIILSFELVNISVIFQILINKTLLKKLFYKFIKSFEVENVVEL